MSTITVDDGALILKDPADIKSYVMDWDAENLATSVTIVTSTWTITALSPSTTDAILTKDQPAILVGGRKTSIRLSAGTLGQLYEVSDSIVTDESPAQTKERSFRILVQQR